MLLLSAIQVLASQPRLLIADEMLCGLDIDRQSSMLNNLQACAARLVCMLHSAHFVNVRVHILQALQIKFGMAILYLTVDLPSFTIMAHDGVLNSHSNERRQP